MKLKQVKIILEKINRLYQSMALDEDNIDVFEKDLMLSYIKQLYDSVDDGATAKATEIKTPVRRIVKPIEQVEKIPVPKTVVSQPRVEIKKEVPVVKEVKVETPAVTYTPPKPQPVAAPTPTPTPTSPPVVTSKAPAPVSPEFDELFEQKQETQELSDKLSAMPIPDLRKAMGLNEKILTRNELFGKDQIAFDDVIQKLNTYSSFDEAKPLLAETATKYNWTAKDKKKKAQIFIKLIKRRYN